MHRRAGIFVHGVPYKRDSQDFDVQCRHNEPGAPFSLGSSVQLLVLQDLPEYEAWHGAIKQGVREILPALRPLLKASSAHRYTIIGGDALIERTGEAKLIELNMYPNIGILGERCRDFNMEVCTPMLQDALAKILVGVERPELERLA